MFTKLTPRLLAATLLTLALSSQANAGVVPLGPAAHHGPKVLVSYSPRHWVPGHTRQVRREIWVPGKTHQVWIAPLFEQRCDPFGIFYQVEVQPGHYVTEQLPGRTEIVFETVFMPGHWEGGYPPLAKPHFGPKVYFGGHKKGSSFRGYGGVGSGKKHKGYGG
jgi:hypothetical protein